MEASLSRAKHIMNIGILEESPFVVAYRLAEDEVRGALDVALGVNLSTGLCQDGVLETVKATAEVSLVLSYCQRSLLVWQAVPVDIHTAAFADRAKACPSLTADP